MHDVCHLRDGETTTEQSWPAAIDNRDELTFDCALARGGVSIGERAILHRLALQCAIRNNAPQIFCG